MRRPTIPVPLLLSLTLWLTACANTQEQEFNRNVAEANFKLGVGYMQSGHYEVAAEKLLKALQYEDDYPEAHNALAVLYEETREYGPADAHYRRAIDLKPDYTLARLNYARFLCLREPVRTTEGENEFQQIIADPNNAGANAAEAYAGLAICARQRDNPDPAQAEAWLRQALDINPNNTNALFELARLSQTQNKTLQARAFLQRYHSQSRPTLQSLWLGITIESSQDGDPLLRRDYSALLVTQYPNSEEARRLKQPE